MMSSTDIVTFALPDSGTRITAPRELALQLGWRPAPARAADGPSTPTPEKQPRPRAKS